MSRSSKSRVGVQRVEENERDSGTSGRRASAVCEGIMRG